MAMAEENVRLQTIVSKEIAKQVDYYAERFEVSQSRMISLMIESCLENDKVFMDLASSVAVKKIVKAFAHKKGKPKLATE